LKYTRKHYLAQTEQMWSEVVDTAYTVNT